MFGFVVTRQSLLERRDRVKHNCCVDQREVRSPVFVRAPFNRGGSGQRPRPYKGGHVSFLGLARMRLVCVVSADVLPASKHRRGIVAQTQVGVAQGGRLCGQLVRVLHFGLRQLRGKHCGLVFNCGPTAPNSAARALALRQARPALVARVQ